MVFEPGNDNKPGHYGILSNDNIKNPDYHIDPNKQNCWLDAVMMQIPPEKFTQLGGTDGILKKGMDHMNANPDVYNQLCETRNQVRQIDGTKLLEGGATEIFSFPYLKALWEGNTKRAQEIADLHHNWELLTVKTLTNVYSNLPIVDTLTLLPYLLYNPKGAVDNLIRIVDETSSRLNDDLNTDYRRVFIEGKRGQVFEDIKYQLLIFGNYKRSNQERKKGNYLKCFGYGTLGTVEAIAIAGGILGSLKGVRTVSKQLKGTTNVKPSGIESTATASAKNLTKQGEGLVKRGANVVEYAEKQAKNWLGKDYKVITNKAGDNIFMSKDGLRKIRFDMKNSHGNKPHIHLQEFINGKWRDAIPDTHRIYPKQ